MLVRLMHEQVRRALRQWAVKPVLATGAASGLDCGHEALGEIARSAGAERLGHGRGNCLSLEDVAEGRKAVTDLMPRPGPRPAASMASHLSIAVN